MSTLMNLLLPCVLSLAAEPVVPVEEDFDTQMLRATVKIKHDQSTATGFILAYPEGNRFLLVTAAHVLEKTQDNETTVVFRTREAEGVYKKEFLKLIIRKDGKPCWTQHPTEDVAVMWIVPPKNVDLPKIPLELLATDRALGRHKVHPGEDACCLGYPHRVEANEAGFPILRKGPIATYPLLPTAKTKTFLLSTNCFEGDSGGPVYLVRPGRTDSGKDEVHLLLGLVTGQHFLDEEMKMVYGTTKLRHRLGLAIVIHASFIRQTIDKLP